MSGGGLIASVEVTHRLRSRVRFRCRFQVGQAADWPKLETLASGFRGVRTARANARALSLTLEFDPELTDEWQLGHALLEISDSATATISTSIPEDHATRNALIASAAVLLGGSFLPRILKFCVSLAAAAPLLREAGEDLVEKQVSSRVLEGLAIAISIARGDYRVANTTNFLLAAGTHLSATTARRSDELLRDLLRPHNPFVWVVRDGKEVEIDADDVTIGDTVIIAAGSVVPVDGRVLSGVASINEAALTGEALPVEKTHGDKVLSGSLVVEGRIAIYAESVGAGTVTARIAEYVQRSLASQGQKQLETARLADKLVPIILSAASGSVLLSGNLKRPASVLQADFSCALRLSTPIAFRFAMYAAGKEGILIKGASALERLAEADTFVFDKTGTLTTGILEVTDSIAFDDTFKPEDLLWLAASVEEHYSFHPVAMAVVEAARATGIDRHFDHQEVEFIVAHGVASTVDDKRIVVGSRHFVEDDEGIDCSAHSATIDKLHTEGKTVLFVGLGGRLLGILGLRDSLRPGVVESLARLRASGAHHILLLTGDRRDKAAEISDALGLDAFYAELLPSDKARIIEELAATGARIAFIGDGINDAPAIAQSHVGIAMQQGADLARMTADVVLLEDDLESVVEAIAISREVMETINQSFHLTIGLNTAILGGAALGALSPLATSILHNGSTIAILLNVLNRRIIQAHQRRQARRHAPSIPPASSRKTIEQRRSPSRKAAA